MPCHRTVNVTFASLLCITYSLAWSKNDQASSLNWDYTTHLAPLNIHRFQNPGSTEKRALAEWWIEQHSSLPFLHCPVTRRKFCKQCLREVLVQPEIPPPPGFGTGNRNRRCCNFCRKEATKVGFRLLAGSRCRLGPIDQYGSLLGVNWKGDELWECVWFQD